MSEIFWSEILWVLIIASFLAIIVGVIHDWRKKAKLKDKAP